MITQGDASTVGAIVLALLLGLAAIGVWVYVDARAQAMRGRPVTGSLGSLHLRTPAHWLAACVLVPEVALLEYLDNRAPA